MHFLISLHSTCPAHRIPLEFVTLTILGEVYKLWSSLLSSFPKTPTTSSLLGPDTLLSTLFSNTLHLCTSFSAREKNLHSHWMILTSNIALFKLAANSPWPRQLSIGFNSAPTSFFPMCSSPLLQIRKLSPAVSCPIRPARPIICLYVWESRDLPWNTGERIMTRRAGRFTPELKVEVATSTLKAPERKQASRMSRSSNVKPVKTL